MKAKGWLAALSALALISCALTGIAVHAADAGMAEAYRAILQEKEAEDAHTRYSLYDLTGDGEPELIYPLYTGSYSGYFTVITYRNGAAEELFGFECRDLHYNPDNHMLLAYKGTTQEHVYIFYELNGTSVEDRGRLTDRYSTSEDAFVYQCFIDGTDGDVTEAEYADHMKAFGVNYDSHNEDNYVPLGNDYYVTDLSPVDALAETPTEVPTEAPTTAEATNPDNPPTGDTGAAAAVPALGAALLAGALFRKKNA